MAADTVDHTTRNGALNLARTIVAANACCEPEDFLRDETTIAAAGLQPNRMPFHMGRPHLALATFGAGVVITVGLSWRAWISRTVSGLERDEIFGPECLSRIERHVRRSGQIWGGPQHRFVCADQLWHDVPAPDDVELQVVHAGPEMEPLYDLDFGRALGERNQTERPDQLAVAARRNGQVVGLAAASADHERMWQIGVGVLAGSRGAGVGAAIVSACTRAVLNAGRVPYYSTHLSHLKSISVAHRCGYVPAWTEAYTYVPRDRRVAGDYLGEERDNA